MAKKTNHVWGLEIGQCALKAIRCHLEGDQVVADMFDFVEYPKILSQPEAEPELLVKDALQQFIGRNDVRNARIAVSVPGQSGLAKFFKPPPVEVKKIPDIVRYEAKQQIPFDLNDVIWDFQQMEGSNIEDGYALESEVGLFAMKREAVYRALKPFRDAGIEVDIIQLAPIAVYNMITYDHFVEKMTGGFDADAPPPSTIVVSMGTDASDLVVTNGYRVWQRNIPIGGNHFTRQLLKDLKLTFAKAEHLKRNVMQSDDPKLVFQVMRPVFNDLVTEIQRSIGFFRSLNKKAEIESVLVLGNSAKLPGLIPFMNKNLGMDVKALDRFERLSGSDVTGQPAFKENQPAFGVVYGLCLQALKQGPMRTNLLPREIIFDRMIRAKKPWAIAALSSVLLGAVANYASVFGSYKQVSTERWALAESEVANAQSTSQSLIASDTQKKTSLVFLDRIGKEVSSNGDRRLLWMELLKTIEVGLRRSEDDMQLTPQQKPYSEREEFHLTRIDSASMDDLSRWFKLFEPKYTQQKSDRERLNPPPEPAPKPVEPAADGSTTEATPVEEAPVEGAENADVNLGPTGPGFIVEINGFHYYNGKRGLEGEAHVRKFLLDFFENGEVELPGLNGEPTKFTVKELGISYPVISRPAVIDNKFVVPNPEYLRIKGLGQPQPTGTEGDEEAVVADEDTSSAAPQGAIATIKDPNTGKEIPSGFLAPKCSFVVEFAWQEKTLADRLWWRQQEGYDKNKVPPPRN